MQSGTSKKFGLFASSALLAAALSLFPAAAQAGLAVAGNDGKQLVKGDPIQVTPDSVSVIDTTALKSLKEIEVGGLPWGVQIP